MFCEALPFTRDYVSAVDAVLRTRLPNNTLSRIQRQWLSFCLTGMLLTNKLSWVEFARKSMGALTIGALSWMFRNGDIPWDALVPASTAYLIEKYGVNEGTLVVDDSDHERARKTTRIYGTHKIFDKKSGGYYNGQCLMVLFLVTGKLSLPVGMAFYRPDPAQQAFKKEEARLIKEGVKSAKRPKAPKPDKDYPSKTQIALNLIARFKTDHPRFTVKAVVADAAFGTTKFMDSACQLAGCPQVISQLKASQMVGIGHRETTVKAYFAERKGHRVLIPVRGGEARVMHVSGTCLWVKAHGKKRMVIAVRNEDEAEFRYLVATDMSWRVLDGIRAYTLRWLVETFFEDWKLYEGWANMAKQPDKDGSIRGLTLSFLLDHALLAHPEQSARLESRAPACTVGSLKQASVLEALVQFVRKIIDSDDPTALLEHFLQQAKALFTLAPSEKHMSGRDLGRQEPTQSLRHRNPPLTAPEYAPEAVSV